MPSKPQTQEQKDQRAAKTAAKKEAAEAKRLANNARMRRNYHKHRQASNAPTLSSTYNNEIVPSGAIIQQGNGRNDSSVAAIMNMDDDRVFAVGRALAQGASSTGGVGNIGIHIGGTVIGSYESFTTNTISSTNNDTTKVTNADLMEEMKELKRGQQQTSLKVVGVARTVRKAAKAWDPSRVNPSHTTPLGQSLKANVEFSPAARPKNLFDDAENDTPSPYARAVVGATVDEEDVDLVESQTSGMAVPGHLDLLFSPMSLKHAVNTVTSPETRSPHDCATVPTQLLKKDVFVEPTTVTSPDAHSPFDHTTVPALLEKDDSFEVETVTSPFANTNTHVGANLKEVKSLEAETDVHATAFSMENDGPILTNDAIGTSTLEAEPFVADGSSSTENLWGSTATRCNGNKNVFSVEEWRCEDSFGPPSKKLQKSVQALINADITTLSERRDNIRDIQNEHHDFVLPAICTKLLSNQDRACDLFFLRGSPEVTGVGADLIRIPNLIVIVVPKGKKPPEYVSVKDAISGEKKIENFVAQGLSWQEVGEGLYYLHSNRRITRAAIRALSSDQRDAEEHEKLWTLNPARDLQRDENGKLDIRKVDFQITDSSGEYLDFNMYDKDGECTLDETICEIVDDHGKKMGDNATEIARQIIEDSFQSARNKREQEWQLLERKNYNEELLSSIVTVKIYPKGTAEKHTSDYINEFYGRAQLVLYSS